MMRNRVNLNGKSGIEELDRDGFYAVIANRALYDYGKASKFAVVNKKQGWLDEVFPNISRARSEMERMAERTGIS